MLKVFRNNDFKTAATTFLEAVKSKNFKDFELFLNPDLDFYAVLPGGKIINNLEGFIHSQKPWFNSSNGSFNYKIRDIQESGQIGIVNTNVDLRSVESQNISLNLKIYITIIFKLYKKSWYLSHLQNTIIKSNKFTKDTT